MKIYVSGTFNMQEELRHRAEQLIKMGHFVDTNWLREVRCPPYMSQEQFWRERGFEDFAQVVGADCIILDNNGVSTSGGRYTEWGIAIAPGAQKLKIWIGDSKGVFSHFADHIFETWEACLSFLEQSRVGK